MASGVKSIRPFISQWKKKKTRGCNYMDPNVGLIRNCRTSFKQILKNEVRGKKGGTVP